VTDTTDDGAESGNRGLLDRLIFEQDLNEVHLLIDFVSGRADRSLSTLAMPNPAKLGETMTAGEIVGAITQMRYPPRGSDAVNSANAAILLMAKDKLSALAAPARGLTIAYTTMFIDAEVRTIWRRLLDCISARANRKPKADGENAANGNPQEGAAPGRRDTRIDLAATTFPVLQPHARRFRLWRDTLSLLSIPCLLLTALTYWDAGLGRSVLERLDQNWKARAETIQDNPDLVALPCEARLPQDAAKLVDTAKHGENSNRLASACEKLANLYQMRTREDAELGRVFGCAGMHFSIPLHLWCWHWLLAGSAARPSSDQSKAEAVATSGPATTGTATDAGHGGVISSAIRSVVGSPREPVDIDWQTATSILSVFTTYVLPIMFALLGTLIGAFRAILRNIGSSELAPRDFVRMNLGIPTGLIAGIAVGLFLSPTTVPVQGAGGVAGALTLTASGLGFLAGYASQSFLAYLDNVIGTVFPNTAPTNAPAQHQAGAAHA
jgi:hypothetical protein